MIASRVRRQNREAHQETAGSPKRNRELPSPVFHILNIELMGLKLKTKKKKINKPKKPKPPHTKSNQKPLFTVRQELRICRLEKIPAPKQNSA